MASFKVKNFEKFQHYKDRSPPWIKLHGALLEDYDFGVLPDAAKGHLLMIWILASRMENKLPYDPTWIGNRIGANGPVDLDGLRAAGFITDYEPEGALGKREEWPSRYISKELRASIMERDGGKCTACGTEDRLEIDHIQPISQGGTGEAENLQVLCVSCNRRKRATQLRSKANAEAESERSPEREGEQRERQSRTVASQPPAVAATAAEPEIDLTLPAHLDRSADLKTQLFGPCLAWLAQQSGKPADRLRSTVGKWCKDWGDGAVLEAFTAAERESPIDPVAWITATLDTRHGKRTGKPTANETARTGIAQALLGHA